MIAEIFIQEFERLEAIEAYRDRLTRAQIEQIKEHEGTVKLTIRYEETIVELF